LLLNGANTYTGDTTVSAGTLVLGSSGSLASGTISVLGGATLDMSNLPGGTWSLFTGQTLATGGAATVLGECLGACERNTPHHRHGRVCDLERRHPQPGRHDALRVGTVGANYDRFTVNGDLTLGADSVLNVLDGKQRLQAMDEGTYHLMTATGTLTAAGSLTFNLLTDGGTYSTTGTLLGGGTLGPADGDVVFADFLPSLTINGGTLQLQLTFNGMSATWGGAAGDLLWDTAGNWDKGVPGLGLKSRGHDRATFAADAASVPRTVRLPNARVELRSLTLDAPLGSGYTLISGGSASQLGLYSSGVPAALTVRGGTHTLAVPVFVESDLAVTVGSASAGLTFAGSGAITEQGFSAALIKAGSGTLALATANSYSRGTTLNEGVLRAQHAAALGSGVVLINGGLFDASAVPLSTGSLTLAAGSLNLATGKLLSSSGAVLLDGTVNVGGTVSAATTGRYTLLKGTSVGGTLAQGTVPEPLNYYLALSGGSLNLQRRATMGTLTAAAAAPSIITGGSVAVTASLFNVAPLLSDDLSLSLVALDNLTGGTVASGIGATLSSGTLGGLWFTGTNVGSLQTGSLRAVGVNTTNGSLGATVSVNVYGHAVPQASGGTITLTNVITGYTSLAAGSNSLSLSNTGTYAVNLKTTGTVTSGSVTINNLSGIVAGGSAGTLSATLSPGRASGVFTETFALNYADDSTLSGASLDLGTWNISVKGTVYDHASPVFTSGSLTLANVRVGYTTACAQFGKSGGGKPGGGFRHATARCAQEHRHHLGQRFALQHRCAGPGRVGRPLRHARPGPRRRRRERSAHRHLCR
jgi:fibronectin-binding autotransporter adhesin